MKLKTLLLFAILSALPTYAGTVSGNLLSPSGLPVKGGTLTFKLQQTGLISGTGAVANTTAQCFTSQGGQVVGVPDPVSLPSIAQTTGSGSLPGGIYFVQYSFYSPTGTETLPSPEIRIQLTNTGSLILSPPATFPATAAGMKVYIGTVSGGEAFQGATTSGTAQYTQSAPIATGTASPLGVNLTLCQIAFNDTIIPYQGYNVSLTSATGNAYPGWPQAWILNGGPSGTVNVSSGAPLWNGTVIYPMPILSQPLNHGPQSISGNLDHGGYNDTNIGTLTAGTANSVVNANLQTGATLDAKIANGLTACGAQCTIYVPAGNYSYANTISLPLNTLSQFTLLLDKGAVLSYTGTGDAIEFPVSGAGPNTTACTMQGGTIIGTSTAQSGIHVQPTNTCVISDVLVENFSSGQGVWFEGANAATLQDSLIINNQNGVLLSPTYCNGTNCGTGVTGGAYTPNLIRIVDNTITGSSQWGILSTDPVTSMLSGALKDVILGNDLELNGTSGPTFGAINFGRSFGLDIESNYLEGAPRQIVLGILGGNDASTRFFASVQTNIINNHFTLETGNPTYEIELQDTDYARIEGNDTTPVAQTSANCFMNATPNSGTNVGETHTYFGPNQVNLTFGGNLYCSGGTFEAFLLGNGSYSAVNTNYLEQVLYGNFLVNGAVTSEVIPIQNMTAAGFCQAAPLNAGAATALTSTFCVSGAGSITLTHPATAGLRYHIFGVLGNLN